MEQINLVFTTNKSANINVQNRSLYYAS